MSIIFFLLIVFTGLKQNLFAQDKTPLLTGSVTISIENGTFECDFILKDIPNIDNYFIRINTGMNPLYFKSKKPHDFLMFYDKSFYDTTSTGESSAYFFLNNIRGKKFLPQEIQFKYVGKYPVIKDTIENYSRMDWKGNIAFNHNSVRADGRQSAWYPVIYDIDQDKSYENIRYDIDIICDDCTTLYINGNIPIKQSKSNFKSDVPRELTLFCGNYEFSNVGETYILNPNLDDLQIQEFTSLINSYKQFYESKLNIPFDKAVTFIETTPVSLENGWLFVAYPTIMNIGWGDNGLKSLFNPKIQNWYRPFIAHELGHFYFGTFKVFNSELGDMMSEGFAEFLSLQLTKEILGIDVYQKKINDKIRDLQGFRPTAFSKIKSESQYKDRELYVYYYAPLIFSAIEQEIGTEKMWNWLYHILTSSNSFTNYEFLVSTLNNTLQNTKQLENIKKRYFEGGNTLQNAIKKMKN